jgi:hypothetical protein
MNHKYCHDCELYWDTTNDGHICNGLLVRVQDSADYCISSWSFLDQEARMKVWDTNCSTAYGDNPTFSSSWSYDSFCCAPGHMIAKAINLREDEIFEDIYEGDPLQQFSYEAFDIHDEESMRQRQEQIADRDRKNEELSRISDFYDDEEEAFMNAERVS